MAAKHAPEDEEDYGTIEDQYEVPEDDTVADDYNPSAGTGMNAPPLPRPEPTTTEFAFFFKELTDTRAPEPLKTTYWHVLDNKDVKFANLNNELVGRMEVWHDMYEDTIFQYRDNNTPDDLAAALGIRYVMLPIISRGMNGFERKMEVTQFSGNVNAGKEEVQGQRKESLISRIFGSHSKEE